MVPSHPLRFVDFFPGLAGFPFNTLEDLRIAQSSGGHEFSAISISDRRRALAALPIFVGFS